MATLLNYLSWRGDLSLAQAPWNEVDALVFARLSYIPFERIAGQMAEQPLKMGDAASALLAISDMEGSVLMKEDLALLRELSTSRRYSDMLLTGYVNRVDEEVQTQFSAITLLIGADLAYIAFRGTDDTLIGWKENFNMGFLFPVPAQQSAVAYLESAAAMPSRRFLLGGHSKGGNLAMYAAAFCREETQRKIRAIYNFDGPGLHKEAIAAPSYRRVRDRIVTYVPQASIVGLLFEHAERYTVIQSTQKAGYLQHNVYTWAVEKDHLPRLEHMAQSSLFLRRVFNDWIASMESGQREQFIDALYALIANTKAHTLQEMDDQWFACATAILASIHQMDDTTWQLIKQCLVLFLDNVKNNLAYLEEPSIGHLPYPAARNHAKEGNAIEN